MYWALDNKNNLSVFYIQESADSKGVLKAKEIAEFLQKYGQPLINVVLEDEVL
jgi:hypothetical protein